MEWKKLNINTNLIKSQGKMSYKIAFPHNSKYDGYCVWISEKLINRGRHNAAVSISYTDDFKFKAIKYGTGFNQYKKIDEKELTAQEFEAAFGVVDENITSKTYKNPYEVHKPNEIEAVEVEALDELKDE